MLLLSSSSILPIPLLLHKWAFKDLLQKLLQIVPSVQKTFTAFQKEKQAFFRGGIPLPQFCSFKELIKTESSFLQLQGFLREFCLPLCLAPSECAKKKSIRNL
jgi:hypothetical protein